MNSQRGRDKYVFEALEDLFDTSKLYERVTLPGGETQGRVVSAVLKDRLLPEPKRPKLHEIGSDQAYALEYQLKDNEMKAAARHHTREQPECQSSQTTEVNMDASAVSNQKPNVMDELEAAHNMSVYNRYDFSNKATRLPVFEYKKTILSMVDAYPVIIIKGHTGSGKSTRVPQYFLDNQREKGLPCNIVVVEPRRIAAISLAERVSLERNWPLGTIVGYKIGQHSEVSEDTRITFCTVGVLLQMLLNANNMNTYTHVIIDEVHERGQELDFLLLIVRKFLRTNSQHVKVILMSATIGLCKFANYFTTHASTGPFPAPIVYILNEKRFEILEYFLEDMQQYNTEVVNDMDHVHISSNHHTLAINIIKRLDANETADYEMKLQRGYKNAKLTRGAVIVFLPGLVEIENLYEQLYRERHEFKWIILVLHSSITNEEQAEVFNPCQEAGYRKIVLSTNLAENSITIPDAVYAINYCMAKQLVNDKMSNCTTLELTWISQANCIQRAGRVGRVAVGKVYHLITREHYNILAKEQVPEMLRCPLPRLVLMAKLLDSGSPKELLALAIEPPDLHNIQSAILQLKETGALLSTLNGMYNKEDGDVTLLGRIMAKLPVDIYVAKLIIFGHLFSVPDDCIIIGAAMSVKNMFASRFREQLNSYLSRLAWADSSNSDPISYLNAYKLWCHRRETGYFERISPSNPTVAERSWAKKCNISYSSLLEIRELIKDIKGRLKVWGFTDVVGEDKVSWTANEEPLILKIVLAGAFYPNYFVRGFRGNDLSEENAVRALGGRDPYTSVYLTNYDEKYPGHLFKQPIKDLLKDCAPDMNVSFEKSSKVYVEFPRDEEVIAEQDLPYKIQLPGRVSLSVYKAIKLRQLGVKLPLKIGSSLGESGQQALQSVRPDSEHCEETMSDNRAGPSMSSTPPSSVPQPILPSLDDSLIEVFVSHVSNAGRFWVQDARSKGRQLLATIFLHLNRRFRDDLVKLSALPKVGQILIAPYENDNFRARVTSIKLDPLNGTFVTVRFIDYGNSDTLHISTLLDFGPALLYKELHKLPAVAIDCRLAEVAPLTLRSCNGQWCEEASRYMREMIVDKKFHCQVYSIVNSVMTVKLLRTDNRSHSINDDLIKLGFAQRSEESYLSKLNHKARQDATNMSTELKQIHEAKQQEQIVEDLETKSLAPFQDTQATRVMNLKGPFSPLEMKLHHVLYCSKTKEITVEGFSVNSVLLDDDLQNKFDRLVVAGSLQTTSQGALMLRQTTMLPNLPGLPALLCLIFSPVVELRTNEDFSRLTGAICGLGYEDMSRDPYFQDHDIELSFDTKFEAADIEKVNHLRNWMNNSLRLDPTQCSSEELRTCQLNIQYFLSLLLQKTPEWQEPEVNLNDQLWGLIPRCNRISPRLGDEKNDIFKPIWGINLDVEGVKEMRAVAANLKELKRMASNKTMPVYNVRCQLCKQHIYTARDLRQHLGDSKHRKSEAEFEAFCGI